MNSVVMIKPDIQEKFDNFMQSGRIALFCAPCGFGKTTVVRELLKTKKTYEISADALDVTALSEKDWNVLIVDNLQLLHEQEIQRDLCEYIRTNPEKRFVFLLRGLPPGWLIPFRYSGLMLTFDLEELFFDRDTAMRLFAAYDAEVSETELSEIMRDTLGYPLGISIIARRLSGGVEYGKKVFDEGVREIFIYFEEAIYKRFELTMRRFLLDLAPFEVFGIELAKMVSGDSGAGDYLINIQQNTNMLILEGLDEFRFWPIFRDFLMWEQQREYSEEQRHALLGRGGLYFELKGEYGKALEYYSKAGESGKVSELLIKSTTLHPGMGQYEKLERYFRTLKDSQIKASPALMQGMSMLCALRMDYDGSERWYNELECFAAVRNKSDAAAKEARSRLTHLDISLPQRGVSGLVKTITTAFKLLTNKEIKLPSFSVTSTLPSIMNGGKDFSQWSKKDDFLYATMRIPVEAILGKDGVGLPDCAIAESKFEKGEDVSSRMLTLVSKISEVQSKGTPDIEFALVGLLAKSQIDSGRAEDANRTIVALRDRFSERNLERFMPNIDAMLCRIALRLGDFVYADEWYRDSAPRDTVTLKTMKRYQYLTQAMVELAHGDYDAVLLTLAPLETFCAACERNIDMIHLKIMTAAARLGKKDEVWRDDIKTALDIAQEFKFIRPISEFGAVALPMITQVIEKKDEYSERLVSAVRNQTVFYPDFLKPAHQMTERLTDAEIQVLRLVCADKSNAEIGEILDIKLATVKSHVSHILQKLGVNRRSEAKTAAEKMKII